MGLWDLLRSLLRVQALNGYNKLHSMTLSREARFTHSTAVLWVELISSHHRFTHVRRACGSPNFGRSGLSGSVAVQPYATYRSNEAAFCRHNVADLGMATHEPQRPF